MPIKILPTASTECSFSEWAIVEDRKSSLVEILAYLYLRQEQNAQLVIHSLAPRRRASKGRVVENVIDKLTAPKPDDLQILATGSAEEQDAAQNRIDTSIWHRDGLLFQHVSWIVARQSMPNGFMTSPHVRQADKGFDGFIIELDGSAREIVRIVLCEDKASEKPRALITSSVWPEIRSIRRGDRDDEILAELTTLLKSVPDIDAEEAVDTIFWEDVRHFRVSVATGKNRRKEEGFGHIVKGYEDVASGTLESRVAGILAFEDVRNGLASLASEVIVKVGELTGV